MTKKEKACEKDRERSTHIWGKHSRSEKQQVQHATYFLNWGRGPTNNRRKIGIIGNQRARRVSLQGLTRPPHTRTHFSLVSLCCLIFYLLGPLPALG